MLDLSNQTVPNQSNPQDQRLHRQVKWLLLFRVLLLSFILGISSVLRTTKPGINIPSTYIIFAFIIFIYFFSIISAVLTNKLKKFATFTFFQILADATFTAIIVYYSGGSRSIFVFVFFFPLISGGLLLFMRGALTISAFSVICYALILSTEHEPLASYFKFFFYQNPPTNLNILLQSFSVYGISFFLVSILSAILARRLLTTELALDETARNLDALSVLYKQIFDDISSGIITIDSKGVITSFNRAAEEITGYAAGEVIGRLADTIFSGLTSPTDQHQRPVITLQRKDQKKVPIGYSWAKLHMPGSQKNYRVYTLQDLSKIKQMEAQLKQNEKMAAIGQIAAGIAHEFRNPLAAISGAAQVLDSTLNKTQTNTSLLKIITRECARLENNISDFLQFSKPAHPEQTWLSIGKQVQESWGIIQQGAQTTPELSTDIPNNLDCWADPHQLKQILINLLHNAAMACAKTSGSVSLRANEEKQADSSTVFVLEVSDTGCGIAQEKLSKIYEPFYTTKENGTGLGLAIVKQIIDGHNGSISCRSTEQGTTFTVKLPLPEAS
nr:PAS domain S-box protein [Desulfobulbaceae bacterium]